MSTRIAIVVLVAGLSAACSGRSDSAATAGSAQGGAGAQAAARMTPEQLEAAMKQIAQHNGALQKSLKANLLPEATKSAQELATQFGEVERFFTQVKAPDAVKLAQTARAGASNAAGAAGAGDATKAMAAAATIGGTCKQCHDAYREGDAKAGYRLKAGVYTP
jgi:cytochrome c556